ncbi:MAG: hypothetical protein PUJ48_11370, partial [Subdoligranulum variabile]|nr:hypothetical protein [Subdoligranulum variabile]
IDYCEFPKLTSRFHKFQFCSIFKVLLCCPLSSLAGQLDYDTTGDMVCQQVFTTFFGFFLLLVVNMPGIDNSSAMGV